MRALPLDLRYALRMWSATPSLSIIAALSLAVGIGANSATFSVLDALLWRPLPVKEPTRLVQIWSLHSSGREQGLSLPMAEGLAARQQSFSAMVGWAESAAILESGRIVARGRLLAVTSNFFDELGVRPVIGRLFTKTNGDFEESRPEPAVIISQRLWEREFGSNPSVVGQVVLVKGIPLTVVGVAPKGFKGLSLVNEPDVMIPLSALGLVTKMDVSQLRDPLLLGINVTGRLRRGVTYDAARMEIETLWPRVREGLASSLGSMQESELRSLRLRVASGAQGYEPYLRERFTRPMHILMAVSVLMLLIASINVAGLMISRAAVRIEQWRIRLALGAQRWHLVRLAVVEGGVIAVIGTLLGLMLAAWSSTALVDLALSDSSSPEALVIGINSRVLVFTCVVAVIATLSFSVAPLWTLLRRRSERSVPLSARIIRGVPRTGQVVVVGQVALSIVLLMTAGLLLQSVRRLSAVDVGYQSKDVVVADLSPRSGGYGAVNAGPYYSELLRRVEALPGVGVASLAHFAPADGGDRKEPVADPLLAERTAEVQATVALVSGGFFQTIELPLQHGRTLSLQDDKDGPRVAVVSSTLADRLFPGKSAVGRHIRIGQRADRQHVEIVGVVADARLYNARDGNTATVFLSHLQEGAAGFYNLLLFKTESAMGPSTEDLRGAVASLGIDDITWVRSLAELQARGLVEERLTSTVAAGFGLLALGLSAVGIYGVMAFAANSRKAEIAIRAAMGASRAALLRTTMGGMMVLVAIGTCIGIPGALLASRVTASLLFGLHPNDPGTLVISASLLFAVGALAAFVPARAASNARPSDALRE